MGGVGTPREEEEYLEEIFLNGKRDPDSEQQKLCVIYFVSLYENYIFK
jgi:hypothetical protein